MVFLSLYNSIKIFHFYSALCMPKSILLKCVFQFNEQLFGFIFGAFLGAFWGAFWGAFPLVLRVNESVD